MKAFKVVYQHGHFIDKETNKRIIPIQGTEYTISGESDAFSLEDIVLKQSQILTPDEKLDSMITKFGDGRFVKILDANTQLFFRMGNSKRVKGDESRQYIFKCKILEDLYLYLLKGKDGSSVLDWRLVECQCILEECLLGGLSLSEKVPAKSLNSLFSQTKDFYFRNQRSGSCDVFHTFFIYQDNIDIYFERAAKELYTSIGDIRKLHVKNVNRKAVNFLD